jgi:hypothetical protein
MKRYCERRYTAIRTENATCILGVWFLGIAQLPGPRWLMMARRTIVGVLNSIKGKSLGSILTQSFASLARRGGGSGSTRGVVSELIFGVDIWLQ